MGDTNKYVCQTDKVDSEMRAWADILRCLGDKWTVLVLGLLVPRPYRYLELNRAVTGISQRMLTLTLKRLERDGLISRTVIPSTPPQVEYALTPLGHKLGQPLGELWAWAQDSQDEIEAARQAYEQKQMMTTPSLLENMS